MDNNKLKSVIEQRDRIINQEDQEEKLAKLVTKYENYKKEPKYYNSKSDPFEEIIFQKNKLIDELNNTILKLKNDIVDLTISYNNKIDQLRSEHQKELIRQYEQIKIKTK